MEPPIQTASVPPSAATTLASSKKRSISFSTAAGARGGEVSDAGAHGGDGNGAGARGDIPS